MRFNIFNPKQQAFAMQINGTSLKLLQLVTRGSTVHLQCFAHTPLPKDVVTNDAISNSDSLASIIENTLTSPTFGHISTKRVGMIIPESKSFVRVIQIPHMSESEIENAVLFEAESYVPMPMDQVYFDWKVLEDTPTSMSILLVAAPKDTVDSYIAVAEAAGLQPVLIEVESQSLCRVLIPDGSKETVLIVDIDSSKTNLIMVELGNLQFSSSIPIAGNTFTDTIAQALGVTKSQAEEIKKKTGISDTPEYPNIRAALLPDLKNLSEEIRNVIRFHYDHSQEVITKLILSGGNAKDKNLSEFLVEELKDMNGIKIELADPWQNITNLQKEVPLDEVESLRYAAMIGLAMRLD